MRWKDILYKKEIQQKMTWKDILYELHSKHSERKTDMDKDQTIIYDSTTHPFIIFNCRIFWMTLKTETFGQWHNDNHLWENCTKDTKTYSCRNTLVSFYIFILFLFFITVVSKLFLLGNNTRQTVNLGQHCLSVYDVVTVSATCAAT